METPIRTLDAGIIRNLSQVFNATYPMFPDFIPAMIRAGNYQVIDSTGTILTVEQAEKIIYGESEC